MQRMTGSKERRAGSAGVDLGVNLECRARVEEHRDPSAQLRTLEALRAPFGAGDCLGTKIVARKRGKLMATSKLGPHTAAYATIRLVERGITSIRSGARSTSTYPKSPSPSSSDPHMFHICIVALRCSSKVRRCWIPLPSATTSHAPAILRARICPLELSPPKAPPNA